MLEQDPLLSTFVSRHLSRVNSSFLQQYDDLINGESNYWMRKEKLAHDRLKNEIMKLVREDQANQEDGKRTSQLDI